jgi:hypothetical protein
MIKGTHKTRLQKKTAVGLQKKTAQKKTEVGSRKKVWFIFYTSIINEIIKIPDIFNQ